MIKDYKLRRGVISDFYEKVAKPITEKVGEQIKKKQEEQAENITEKLGEQIAKGKCRGFHCLDHKYIHCLRPK